MTIGKWGGPLAFLVCLGIAALWVHRVMVPSDEVKKEYVRLLQMSQETRASSQPVHVREGVQRDLFLWHQNQRLHVRLKGEKSTLTFLPASSRPLDQEVVEQFHCLEGWMQEVLFYQLPDGRGVKLQQNGRWLIEGENPTLPQSWIEDPSSLTPMQIVRTFAAETGSFNYKKKTLQADQILLKRHVLPGHQFQDPSSSDLLLMDGIARRMVVDLGVKGTFSLSGEQIQMTFFSSPFLFPSSLVEKQPWMTCRAESLTLSPHEHQAEGTEVEVCYENGMTCSAKRVYFQKGPENVLSLERDVCVNVPEVGKLFCEERAKVFHRTGETRPYFCRCSGKTTMAYQDPEKAFEHRLTCYGKASLDLEKRHLLLESPVDPYQHVLPGNQVCFQDYMGTITSDQMTVEYHENARQVLIDQIRLEGNVCLRNQFASGFGGWNDMSLEQYALGDVLFYFPQTRKMELRAIPPHRVLFMDKIHQFQGSAPSVSIYRDAHLGKEAIQGHGDVHFSFGEQEMKRLKEAFPHL